MAAGGSVSPSGDMSVFGMSPAGAQGGIGIMPLGVSLVGALLLAWVFLRPLRTGPVAVGELVARVVSTAALFVAVLGGLAWAGHDTVSIDGSALGGAGGKGGGGGGGLLDGIPGIGGSGDLGDLGDLGDFGDGLEDLVKSHSSVGFHVNTGATLLRGLVWVLAVVVIALVASRRTALPRGWEFVSRAVRPAASALVRVLLMAALAGAAAGLYAAATGDEPGRITGGVLLGAPNGAWLAVPLGLFVPWDGSVSGPLAQFLPAPVDRLLNGHPGGRQITLSRLAELDGRVWLLPVAVVLMMLTAGVLNAANAPLPQGGRPGTLRLAASAAVRLGVATAVALPLLVRVTGVSVDANVSVFGIDAVGAGLKLNGDAVTAVALGAVWGAAAGFAGALMFAAAGAGRGRERAGEDWAGQTAAAKAPAGQAAAQMRAGQVGGGAAPAASAQARPGQGAAAGQRSPWHGAAAGEAAAQAQQPGPYNPRPPYRPEGPEHNPYRDDRGSTQPPDHGRSQGGDQGRSEGAAEPPARNDSPTLPDVRRPRDR
ncbi:hypothetical protein GCM10012280_04690 [Wenjunlia tyrosinilytica]|uniref:Integral membrane protein n=2 Tax=Wenjunlia tyrosinilytica TaxID=1544741 RepID=A0A917ZE65_9ACTN|nr:hypothetical protein GCM10012280_04690 [Wenjunlia tyrosinilytica]